MIVYLYLFIYTHNGDGTYQSQISKMFVLCYCPKFYTIGFWCLRLDVIFCTPVKKPFKMHIFQYYVVQ